MPSIVTPAPGLRASHAPVSVTRHPWRGPGRPPARPDSPGWRPGGPEAMTWPKSSTCTVEQICSTRSVSCSTSRMARPSAASDVRRRPRRRSRAHRDRRTARRAGGPSDRSTGRGPARPGGPTRSAVTTPARRPPPPRPRAPAGRGRQTAERPCSPASSPTRTLSAALRVEKSSRRWKVRAIPSRARRYVRVRVTSVPPSDTEPLLGRCRPVMTLNNVVLPAPFGPISPVTDSRFGTERDAGEGGHPAEADAHMLHGERGRALAVRRHWPPRARPPWVRPCSARPRRAAAPGS